MQKLSNVDMAAILDSLSGGVYVCDSGRTIRYWSKSAQRITGWEEDQVIGRRCSDGILCHIDKDGHRLCGEEYCPLHRAMVTGKASREPLLVYAQHREGGRVPMFVSVSPIRNGQGRVVGGVETFEDASSLISDFERAKAIQRKTLEQETLEGVPGRINTYYVPRDIVGGDFYAIRKLAENQYGVILADVMGHGIAAALYTMHLSSLWQRHWSRLTAPTEFMACMNEDLMSVVQRDESFATACAGVLDFEDGYFRFAGAGCPPVLVMHKDGTHEAVENPGLPLGIVEGADYEETLVELRRGDGLLLFSDGAFEIRNADDKLLGVDGVVRILREQGYPGKRLSMESLEEELLKYSSGIRLEDDLTVLEATWV
jgi:PAS domain S-box-containing protein